MQTRSSRNRKLESKKEVIDTFVETNKTIGKLLNDLYEHAEGCDTRLRYYLDIQQNRSKLLDDIDKAIAKGPIAFSNDKTRWKIAKSRRKRLAKCLIDFNDRVEGLKNMRREMTDLINQTSDNLIWSTHSFRTFMRRF